MAQIQALKVLKHANFRLFWVGQGISLIGTWMQQVAQAWLVLELTNSAFWLGMVSAVQFTPILLFSLYAGVWVDRLPKKQVLLYTQSTLMVLALLLALDVGMQWVQFWHLIIFAAVLGTVTTLDLPARNAFIADLVDKEDIKQAIVLTTAAFNLARILGPVIGGLIIAKYGVVAAYLFNAGSFLPLLLVLFLINISGLRKSRQKGTWPEIIEGLKYIKSTPRLLFPILFMAILSLLALNFNVLVPLLAKNVLSQEAKGFGLLMSATGIGALLGALATLYLNSEKQQKHLMWAGGLGLCSFQLFLTVTDNFWLAFLFLGLTGICMFILTTSTSTQLQETVSDDFRGRVMSVYTLVFAGVTPIGNFMAGTLAQVLGVQLTIGLSAGVALTLAVLLIIFFQKDKTLRNIKNF